MTDFKYGSRIVGTGIGVPSRVMTNKDFEKYMDTSDEWISSRTGIKERRICDRSKGEDTLSLATDASKKAIEMAGASPEEIDLVIVGTVTPQSVMPTTANLIQNNLSIPKGFSFDLQAACSGFMYGLSIADQYMKTGEVKKALVVGVESLSTIVNFQDRSTAVLFGDAAGAVVVERTEDDHRILGTKVYSDGSKHDFLCIPHGYAGVPPHAAEYSPKKHKVHMNGREIFKYAVRNMESAAREVVADAGMTLDDVDYFLFHQANLRIVDSLAKSMKIDKKKTWINLDRYGNTSAATLPICLDEAWKAGKVGPGSVVLLATFGGGITWASGLVRL